MTTTQQQRALASVMANLQRLQHRLELAAVQAKIEAKKHGVSASSAPYEAGFLSAITSVGAIELQSALRQLDEAFPDVQPPVATKGAA